MKNFTMFSQSKRSLAALLSLACFAAMPLEAGCSDDPAASPMGDVAIADAAGPLDSLGKTKQSDLSTKPDASLYDHGSYPDHALPDAAQDAVISDLRQDATPISDSATPDLPHDTAAPDHPRHDLRPDLFSLCTGNIEVKIDVSNTCKMTIAPTEIVAGIKSSINICYHNISKDYKIDVWMSYGGGFLDLAKGGVWNEKFIWCAGPKPSTGYATISAGGGCAKQVLKIICK